MSDKTRRWLFLPELERHADLSLLLLRIATGCFLLYQSHDNLLSSERMEEFASFLRQFGFWQPDLLAPLSIFWQVAAGIGFILGLLTRWLGLVTAFNFAVAVWMVPWNDPVPGIWPAAVLVVIGLHLGLRGSGRFGIDAALQRPQRR